MAEETTPQKSSARVGSRPILWVIAAVAVLALGAAIGAAGYRAIARAAPDASKPFAKALPPTTPRATTGEGDARPEAPPQVSEPTEGPVNGHAGEQPAAPDPLPGRVPPSLPGSMPSLPLTPIVVENAQSEWEKEARKLTRYVEVSLRVPQADIEVTTSRLAALAGALGGSSHSLFEVRTPISPERGGILLIVPEDKADKALASVLVMDVASILDQWTGPFAERQLRVERPLREALQSLDREERIARERYLDDAPAVLDVRERIEEVRRQLTALPKAGSDRVVLRVYIGHRV